jgi:hypothetical protein
LVEIDFLLSVAESLASMSLEKVAPVILGVPSPVSPPPPGMDVPGFDEIFVLYVI